MEPAMTRFRCLIALSVAFAASPVALPAQAASPFDRDSVKCESKDTRRETCDVSWPGQTSLVRQISATDCVQGRTWGATPGKVWVSGGCRAEFGPRFSGKEIRCESADGRHETCGRDLHGNADLIRQLSDAPCREGSTWGQSGGSIWVDKGCRGVFRVGESNGRYSVTCGSENGRRLSCPWNARYGRPALLETLSKSPCTQGRSWGYDGKGAVWVDEGCRARFGVR